MLSVKKKIHFIGIGGIGMSGIAEILLGQGHQISGSDISSNQNTERLKKMGAKIFSEHLAENVSDVDCVVFSSAIKENNPELQAAKKKSLMLLRRAEMLGELLRMKRGILVAGSHGKTTTTSMISMLLHSAGLDPTVCVGGQIDNFGSNARLGSGQHFVAEADESDGSFTYLVPRLAVVTNIDREHMDHYGTMENQLQAFIHFLNQTEFNGSCILCLDDHNLAQIIPQIRRKKLFYGLNRQANWRAEDIQLSALSSQFKVIEEEKLLGEITINQPGEHNVQNALAAIATARSLGINLQQIQQGFNELKEIKRRFQYCGKIDGISVYDDYGHHPTEVRATLKAARKLCPGKLHVAFQPHRYSRTKDQLEQFATSFADADQLLLLPIYAAGEKEIPGIDHHLLAEKIIASGHRNLKLAENMELALKQLKQTIKSGDLLLTLGAGDIHRLAQKFLSGGEVA